MTKMKPEVSQQVLECYYCGEYAEHVEKSRRSQPTSHIRVCEGCRETHIENRIREHDNAVYQEKIKHANIPKSHEKSCFENYILVDDSVQRAILDINQFNISDELLCLLIGKHGTGKTHLACASMHGMARAKQSVYYTRSTKIAMMLADINARLEQYKDLLRYRYLVIDEFGRENKTDYVISTLTEILYDRYENNKKTLLISNLSSELLKNDVIFNAIKDRLDRKIVLNTTSYREKQRHEKTQ